jgi:hypothetical protein
MEILLYFVAVIAAVFGATFINRKIAPSIREATSAQGETTSRLVTAVAKAAVWTLVFVIAFAIIGVTSSFTGWFISFVIVAAMGYFIPTSLE